MSYRTPAVICIKPRPLKLKFQIVVLIYRWTCKKIRPFGINLNLSRYMHTGHVLFTVNCLIWSVLASDTVHSLLHTL